LIFVFSVSRKPLGCGKTLIAKAIANETGADFIHIKVSLNTSPFLITFGIVLF